MAINNIIQAILTLPQKFNAVGNNKSSYRLLRETGYFEFHDQIRKNAIAAILLSNRDSIKEWIQWSKDKRSSEGWYLNASDEKYEIGKMDPNGVIEQNLVFLMLEMRVRLILKEK